MKDRSDDPSPHQLTLTTELHLARSLARERERERDRERDNYIKYNKTDRVFA